MERYYDCAMEGCGKPCNAYSIEQYPNTECCIYERNIQNKQEYVEKLRNTIPYELAPTKALPKRKESSIKSNKPKTEAFDTDNLNKQRKHLEGICQSIMKLKTLCKTGKCEEKYAKKYAECLGNLETILKKVQHSKKLEDTTILAENKKNDLELEETEEHLVENQKESENEKENEKDNDDIEAETSEKIEVAAKRFLDVDGKIEQESSFHDIPAWDDDQIALNSTYKILPIYANQTNQNLPDMFKLQRISREMRKSKQETEQKLLAAKNKRPSFYFIYPSRMSDRKSQSIYAYTRDKHQSLTKFYDVPEELAENPRESNPRGWPSFSIQQFIDNNAKLSSA